MSLNVTQMVSLISRLKDSELDQPVVVKTRNQSTAIDVYDLRYITKLEAKKIPHADVIALIRYGNHYLTEVSGQFLSKVNKYGRQFADFEEAGANKEIATSLTVLTQELKRRQE